LRRPSAGATTLCLRKGGRPGRDKPQFTLCEREAIDAVDDRGHAALKQLTDCLGGDRSNLYTRLQNLCARGALDCVQTARGYEYILPCPEAPSPSTLLHRLCLLRLTHLLQTRAGALQPPGGATNPSGVISSTTATTTLPRGPQ
jgi:hypothetical protein